MDIIVADTVLMVRDFCRLRYQYKRNLKLTSCNVQQSVQGSQEARTTSYEFFLFESSGTPERLLVEIIVDINGGDDANYHHMPLD